DYLVEGEVAAADEDHEQVAGDAGPARDLVVRREDHGPRRVAFAERGELRPGAVAAHGQHARGLTVGHEQVAGRGGAHAVGDRSTQGQMTAVGPDAPDLAGAALPWGLGVAVARHPDAIAATD